MSKTRRWRPWPRWATSWTVGPQTYIDTLPGSRVVSSTNPPIAVSWTRSTPVRYPHHAVHRPGKADARGSRGEVARPLGGRGHLPLRPLEGQVRDLFGGHAAPDGERQPPY